MDLKIKKVMDNLEKNNMKAYYAENKEEAYEKVKELLAENSTVSVGGSVTVQDCGIMELLKSGKYNFLDRSVPGLTPDEIREIYIKTFSADTFLGSCNALTEDGYLYDVDGNGNRIAAMIFGPKQVIIIAGVNKIVENAEMAVKRVKEIAAPKNAARLGLETYCTQNGNCVSLNKENPEICDGCLSENRICADYVFFGRQRIKDRIKVIIVNETLGF